MNAVKIQKLVETDGELHFSQSRIGIVSKL